MTLADQRAASLSHPDRFFIGGEWVEPSSDAMIRGHRLGQRRGVPLRGRGQGSRHGPGRRRRPAQAFDEGPWPTDVARRARRLPAGHGRRADAKRAEDFGPGLAPRVRRAALDRPVRRHRGAAATFEYYAGLAETFPFEEPATPSRGPVRAAGAGAGRRRRRHHPLERPARPDQLQDRPGAAGRLHGRAQVVARGAGRGLRGGRGRRSGRAAARVSSTWSPPTARCPSCWCGTRGSTRSPSPGRPRPAGGSRRSAGSASPAAPSSSAASRRRSSSTTWTSPRRRPPWRPRNAC